MKDILAVILTSALPVSELRGAIFNYHFTPFKALAIYLIGNLLQVLFLLLVFASVAEMLRNFFPLKKFFLWLQEWTQRHAELVKKYEFLRLVLFVAAPFLITGAWTGSFAAAIFKTRFRQAVLAIIPGVFIVTAAS